MLLVSGATKTVKRYADNKHVGRLATPTSWNCLEEMANCGMAWAADNDCFRGLDPDNYFSMLNTIASVDASRLLFISVPDVVADHHASAALFRYWYPALKRRKLPAAFVAQDGASIDGIPWDDISAIFIGGSTRWKLGQTSERIMRYAKKSGKWIHVGRVNTQERLRHCAAMGVDSVDGTQFSKWPDTHIPWAVRLLEQEHVYLF